MTIKSNHNNLKFCQIIIINDNIQKYPFYSIKKGMKLLPHHPAQNVSNYGINHQNNKYCRDFYLAYFMADIGSYSKLKIVSFFSMHREKNPN